jgi:hypothetical protein
MYLLPTYTERVTKPTINKEKRKKEKRKKEMVSRKKKSPQFIWQRIISLVKSKAFKMIQHSVLPAIRITIIVFGYFNGLRVWETEMNPWWVWLHNSTSHHHQTNLSSLSENELLPHHCSLFIYSNNELNCIILYHLDYWSPIQVTFFDQVCTTQNLWVSFIQFCLVWTQLQPL